MKSTTEQKLINLNEVSFIRPLLILMVVLYHAMAIHTGNWALPEGTQQIGIYAAIGRIVYFFMLETFVFISGYLYAFQRANRGEESFSILIRKKTKRLLLPCWIFGVFYYLLFGCEGPWQDVLFTIVTGIGHLWFLFMLFVCFVIARLLIKFKMNLGGGTFSVVQ